uniref:U2-hexatoxin-Hi1a n=1 Tax=Hadronyche infensa TaxID=153481 RepID=T21A_HADIN|nr:RecName: Full=U2-hexatoxin-Hi1a; Short=U2-HXTX-Hi1a; AltName: Full=Toxin AcTx-Hi:OB4219; Flags: Precursor [Hadronyche infensa]
MRNTTFLVLNVMLLVSVALFCAADPEMEKSSFAEILDTGNPEQERKCLAEAADCSPWSGDSCCKPYLCSCIFFYPCSCRPKGW